MVLPASSRQPHRRGHRHLLWGYVFVVLAPMALIVINSMRPTRQIFREPIALPESINFDSYVTAWGEANFSQYFVNSVLIVVASVVLATAVSALAAYVLGPLLVPGQHVPGRSSSCRACCCRFA